MTCDGDRPLAFIASARAAPHSASVARICLEGTSSCFVWLGLRVEAFNQFGLDCVVNSGIQRFAEFSSGILSSYLRVL